VIILLCNNVYGDAIITIVIMRWNIKFWK
jgi:hypothetical protein